MDSKTYEELHGSNNWEGLLDPLDLGLRTLILGYGDLSNAAERAFNSDQGSIYNGYSHYGKTSFFKGVMLPWADSNYKVTSFLYATASIGTQMALLFKGISSSSDGSKFDTNWMGYIAVSNDEFSKSIGHREICIVWRGTTQSYEWINDVKCVHPASLEPLLPLPPPKDGGGKTTTTPQVMGGWLTIYNTSDPDSKFIKESARTQLLARIKELLVIYKHEKVSITCTGHSLGACLSILSAFDLATNVATPDINISAFVFACPQVGNEDFKTKIEEVANLKILRIKNDPDIIPFWPSKIMLPWKDKVIWKPVPSGLLQYVDIGVELLIDSQKSPYLKDKSGFMVVPLVAHNLQGMLHTLGGWNGKNGEFDWGITERDLGLVNMSTDFLKEDLKIPVSWWTEKNKGMVLNDDGHWIIPPIDPRDHDIPNYE